jgi:protein-tyrosine phosphatase
MSEPVRLLFVCLGNICRSPAAENVMRALVEREGLATRFEIDSAGTAGYHIGKGPDSRMVAAGRRRGLPMTGRARQAKPADFERYDWIFAMDRSNYEDLAALGRRSEASGARLVAFCELCESHAHDEVPDPYYGGPEGFEEVLDLLEDGCAAFLRRWRTDALGRLGETPG